MRKFTKIAGIVILSIILKGCSFTHLFQIKNSTETTWKIEYKINDKRGVFQNQVYFEGKNSKEDNLKKFPGNNVQFSLKPNETVTIGTAINSNYGAVKEQTKLNNEAPWIDFLNVDTIFISNETHSFKLATNDWEPFCDKISYRKTRVDVARLMKSAANPIP